MCGLELFVPPASPKRIGAGPLCVPTSGWPTIQGQSHLRLQEGSRRQFAKGPDGITKLAKRFSVQTYLVGAADWSSQSTTVGAIQQPYGLSQNDPSQNHGGRFLTP